MKRHYADIGGDWAIIFAYDIYMYDLDHIADWLESLGAGDDEIREACQTILKYNTGFTYSNNKLRMSLVCISRATTIEEWVNTLAHEIDHVQEAFCEYYDIPLGGEDAAYLQGDIAGSILHSIIDDI